MVNPILISAACVILVLILGFALHRSSVKRRRVVVAVLVFVGVPVGMTVWIWNWPESDSKSETKTEPTRVTTVGFRFPPPKGTGYIGSNSCRECHADQHKSWHASYHRKMTQPASPETVLAHFDDVRLNTYGLHATLSRVGDEFFVEAFDPMWERDMFLQRRDARREPEPHRKKSKVVMVTGSHNFQAYWILGPKGKELIQFPWRYHLAQRRWVHRKDVFHEPPGFQPGMYHRVWNNTCIFCHSSGGQPGMDEITGFMKNTKVAELGISCESCHGPAERHVAAMRRPSPENRSDRVGENLAITNPKKLSHQLSSQVCGQCHSHFDQKHASVAQTGATFRPGDRLDDHIDLKTFATKEFVTARYWNDGACRSGGREFSGMSTSKCYVDGKMSCMSCHSMHKSDPDGQLATKMRGNHACYQCHKEYKAKLAEHTHHSAGSSGSLCYNCHMPHSSYALFKGIRSHRVDSPRVSSIVHNSRPNACNLCHLDRTLKWTSQKLTKWYNIPAPELKEDERQVSAAVLWLLRGDSGQRGIVAWHAGWTPAMKTSGSDWIAPILAQSLDDPYSTVRWLAYVSLKNLPGFAEFKYEFDGPPRDRTKAVNRARSLWEKLPEGPNQKISPKNREHILLKSPRKIDRMRYKEILKGRDEKRISIIE